MTLDPGTTLGTFEIKGILGKGGMGEVYRALDTKLGREVAIKVLPEDFAADPERLTRFEREAKTLASLNHNHIGALYDFKQDGEVRFLVMELVQGETLADRIDRGPLSVDQTLPLFVQIAEALEAAHENGIIHRDLKPANIIITPGEEVKVVDFGIAKSIEPVRASAPTDPTLVSNPIKVTTDGTILGTPSYMSPEQARGQEVDRRTDIWAFGCTFFEALTGKPPFEAATRADLVVKILGDTADWSQLPRDTPEIVRSILRRCLERDTRRRLKDAGDIAIALEEAQGAMREYLSLETNEAARSSGKKTGIRGLIPVIVTVLMVSLAGALWWMTRSDETSSRSGELANAVLEPKPVRRFSIGLSAEYPIKRPNPVIGDNPLALSPDGRTLVYVSESGGKTQLIARELDQLEARPIPGSEYAWSSFFPLTVCGSGSIREVMSDRSS